MKYDRAKWLYLALILVTVGLSQISPARIGMMAIIALGFLIRIVQLVVMPRFYSPKGADEKESDVETAEEGPREPLTQPTKKRRERLHFLDNLKSFLTIVVVVHHSLCAFVGQGYVSLSLSLFMSLS